VNIVAATNDASTVTSIEAILDGAEVSHFQSGVLETSVNAEAGNHHLVVKARDKSGTSFESSVDFNVSSPVVPGPPLPTPTPASERLSLTISPSEAAITLGHSADFSVQLGTDGSLKDPVSFSCSGLPAGTRCAFDPVRMKAANLPGTVKLTIFTNAVTSASIRGGLRGLIWASILAPGMVLLGYKRRGRGVLLSLCGLFLLATGLLLGCQGVISPANKGSFTVTVTSSSGTVQKSSNINLKLE
jgi:hypothetical protein